MVRYKNFYTSWAFHSTAMSQGNNATLNVFLIEKYYIEKIQYQFWYCIVTRIALRGFDGD